MRRIKLPALLAAGLVLGLLVPASTAVGGATPTSATPRSSNAAYSWWTSPTVKRTSSSFYFTGVSSEGYQRVYRWSRNRQGQRVLTYVNLRKRGADDHNAPALSIARGKPSLVVYTGHPGTMFVRRTSTSAEPTLRTTTSSFGPEVALPFAEKTTYAQILRDGDRVVVLTRYLAGGSSGWYYVTSADSGLTWSQPYELFDSESHQAYLLVRPTSDDPSTLHVMAYWHPKYGPENAIGYRQITFDQLWSGAAERFTVAGMERIWASDPGGSGTQQVRLLDGGDKAGHTMVFIATWDADHPVPVYRQLRRETDGSWSSTTLRSAGATFGQGNGNYIPGVTLDSRRGVDALYMGYRSGPRWNLARTSLDASGRIGSSRVLVSSRTPLARPVSAGADLLFQTLTKYVSYTNYKIAVQSLRVP